MSDYIFVKTESASGTFEALTGETALPVLTKTRALGQNWIDVREAGASRSLYDAEQGARRPTASIEFRCQARYMLVLLKSLFNVITTSTPATATNTRDHAFYMNDAAVMNTFSMQTQETRGGATRTLNWRGCQVISAEFTFEQDNYGTVSLEIAAMEVTPAGTAFLNGNSSPAAITVTTPTTVKKSFGFPNVTVTYGATLTLDATTKRYTKAGGTTLTGIESLTISINHGAESRVFLDKLYPQSHVLGNREVTFSIVLADDTPALTFFDTKVRTKTSESLFIEIDNGVVIETTFTEEFDIALPTALYQEPTWADISGEHGVRNLTIAGVGLHKSEIGGSLHIQARDDVASIS